MEGANKSFTYFKKGDPTLNPAPHMGIDPAATSCLDSTYVDTDPTSMSRSFDSSDIINEIRALPVYPIIPAYVPGYPTTGTETIWAEKSKVPYLIGTGGKTIRELENLSGARIQVPKVDVLGTPGDPPMRAVLISGNAEQRRRAEK